MRRAWREAGRRVASRRVSTLSEACEKQLRTEWKWQVASRRLTTGSVVHELPGRILAMTSSRWRGRAAIRVGAVLRPSDEIKLPPSKPPDVGSSGQTGRREASSRWTRWNSRLFQSACSSTSSKECSTLVFGMTRVLSGVYETRCVKIVEDFGLRFVNSSS